MFLALTVGSAAPPLLPFVPLHWLGVGFYGMLPFWTAVPGGKVAPQMPPAVPGTRTPWGRYVAWGVCDGIESGQPSLFRQVRHACAPRVCAVRSMGQTQPLMNRVKLEI